MDTISDSNICTVYFGSDNTLRDDQFLKRDGKVKRTHWTSSPHPHSTSSS